MAATAEPAPCPLGNTGDRPTISTCFGDDASCGDSSDSVICPAGAFADLATKQCRKCDRGGFFSADPGRMGWGSHCACSPCNNGTFSNTDGATRADDCEVCPSGTQTTGTTAGYRACPCLPGFSRTDRFGPCEPCSEERGIICKDDVRSLEEGFFWMFDSPGKQAEYDGFACDLYRSDGYNRSLSTYDGTFPPSYECPTPSNCLGGVASQCAEGTTGPLCAVCDTVSRFF